LGRGDVHRGRRGGDDCGPELPVRDEAADGAGLLSEPSGGGILVAFGIYVMVRGLLNGEKIKGSWSLRARIVLPLSMVLFGILMQYAGFILALAVLVFGSAASGREFRLGEVFLVAVVLILLSVAVFIWGLGLPYPLLKGF